MLTKLKDAVDYGRMGEWKKEEVEHLYQFPYSIW